MDKLREKPPRATNRETLSTLERMAILDGLCDGDAPGRIATQWKYRQRPSDAVRQANHEWKEGRTLGQGNRNSVAAYVEAVSGWQETVTTYKGTWYHVRVHRNRRRSPNRLG